MVKSKIYGFFHNQSAWVVHFVYLWLFKLTKECAFINLGVKVSNFILGAKDITCTTKSMIVTDIEFPFSPQYIWSLFQNRSYKYSILYIASSVNLLNLEMFWNWVFTKHGSYHLLESFVLLFFTTHILLRCPWWREIVVYTIWFTEHLKFSIFKLRFMVT